MNYQSPFACMATCAQGECRNRTTGCQGECQVLAARDEHALARPSQAQESAFLDATRYGTGAYIQKSDGSREHIPLAQMQIEQPVSGAVDERKTFDKLHIRWNGFKRYSIWNEIEQASAWKAWQSRAQQAPAVSELTDDTSRLHSALASDRLSAAQRDSQPVAQSVCQTCSGNGMIGGPSYYHPDEGGEPCPDCSQPVANTSADARDAARYRKLILALHSGDIEIGDAIIKMEVVGACPNQGEIDAYLDAAIAASREGNQHA